VACIIAPHRAIVHRYPVDCWRFNADGFIALAKYNRLSLLHAHHNRYPQGKEAEFIDGGVGDDAMLVARKDYSGPARLIDLQKHGEYVLNPVDLDDISGGLIAYQAPRQPLTMPARIYRKIGRIAGFII
jgi:hypothetical protein